MALVSMLLAQGPDVQYNADSLGKESLAKAVASSPIKYSNVRSNVVRDKQLQDRPAPHLGPGKLVSLFCGLSVFVIAFASMLRQEAGFFSCAAATSRPSCVTLVRSLDGFVPQPLDLWIGLARSVPRPLDNVICTHMHLYVSVCSVCMYL